MIIAFKFSNTWWFLETSILSRNHSTSHLNTDVGKLSNRDIQWIIRQWVKEKPVVEIAWYFQITRQRVYQRINLFEKRVPVISMMKVTPVSLSELPLPASTSPGNPYCQYRQSLHVNRKCNYLTSFFKVNT